MSNFETFDVKKAQEKRKNGEEMSKFRIARSRGNQSARRRAKCLKRTIRCVREECGGADREENVRGLVRPSLNRPVRGYCGCLFDIL